jgi:hypothetical protein
MTDALSCSSKEKAKKIPINHDQDSVMVVPVGLEPTTH